MSIKRLFEHFTIVWPLFLTILSSWKWITCSSHSVILGTQYLWITFWPKTNLRCPFDNSFKIHFLNTLGIGSSMWASLSELLGHDLHIWLIEVWAVILTLIHMLQRTLLDCWTSHFEVLDVWVSPISWCGCCWPLSFIRLACFQTYFLSLWIKIWSWIASTILSTE